jgi:hypothetical protein
VTLPLSPVLSSPLISDIPSTYLPITVTSAIAMDPVEDTNHYAVAKEALRARLMIEMASVLCNIVKEANQHKFALLEIDVDFAYLLLEEDQDIRTTLSKTVGSGDCRELFKHRIFPLVVDSSSALNGMASRGASPPAAVCASVFW